MSIKVGDKFPQVTLKTSSSPSSGSSCKPNDYNPSEEWKGKTVVLFSVPGAFSPTCSEQHVPSYLAKYDELKAKGVDIIACVTPNDVHVLHHWGIQQKIGDKVLLLADGNQDLTRALGWEFNLTQFGLGAHRIKRGLIILKDLKVVYVATESGRGIANTGAQPALNHL
ncbi:antioxidant, AhpC/Tsa family, partial [Conidiobolus coronatus NRRL 28638]